MATTFTTSQLDFENIKQSLKTYLQRSGEFEDYDFEASGLNNILDVLAYNTHFNALIANFSLNEAYLNTAQLRSSVVSIATSLGYKIRSRAASRADLKLSLNLSSASIKPAQISLPAGTRFTASVDGVSYTFQTQAEYVATNDDGIYIFKTADDSEDIPVYEGTARTKTFIVQEEDERQIFIIPDETIDTSQVTVKVFDTYNTSTFTAYTDIASANSVNENSTFYRIVETPNGRYELNFGDGITTGKKPTVGNKVTIDYLATAGPDANGANSFTPVSQVTVNGVNYDLTVSLSAVSHGGAFRESIESIRLNAPLGFAAQQRLVTAEDYKTTILSNYAPVSDAIAWGGEDNDPPNYGVVYVGLLFDDNTTQSSQQSVKNDFTNNLNENLAILSVDVEFVDPVATFLEFACTFNFNPNLTGLTRATVEKQVFATIRDYVNDNLKTFTGTYRKSNLATEIDAISPAILSTLITTKMQQRLTPITEASVSSTSQTADYTLNFPVPIAAPSATDFRITSTIFSYNGVDCLIRNKLSDTKLQIIRLDGTIEVDNIGEYTASNGRISLSGFSPGLIASGDSFIKITATPASDGNITPLRN